MPYDTADPVNESTIFQGAAAKLGQSLRQARKLQMFTQKRLGATAGIDLATVQGLERGRGTLGSLIAVLGVLKYRLADQPPELGLGDWIVMARKSAGYTQAAIALRIGVSKPTIIQIEHGRGNIGGFLRVLVAFGFAQAVLPQVESLHGARMILGDCMEVLPTLADRSIDAILTDLPYSSTDFAWDQHIPLAPLWKQFRRLLKPTGAVVLTASQPFTARLVMSNPEWFKYAMVWEKTRSTGFLQAKQMPLKKHEDICIFSPGVVVGRNRSNRQMTYNPEGLVPLARPLMRSNGLTEGTYIGRVQGNPTVQTHTNYPTSIVRFPSEAKPIHPTQKPLELMRYLIRTYTNEGDTVLDCCVGSGTTGVAAVAERRKFIGVERDPTYFQMAEERIATQRPSGIPS